MLALTEKQTLIRALGQVIVDEVKTAVDPLIARVTHIETIVCRDDLCTIKDANDLRDQLLSNIAQFRTSVETQFLLVQQQFLALPTPKDGIDGKDADMPAIEGMIAANHKNLLDYVDQQIADLPKPEKGEKGDPGEPGKDGRDGRDGADGKSLSLDDIRDCLADLVRKALADIPVPRNCVGGHIDRSGHLFLRFSDGSDSDLGEVAGKDGKDCDLELVRSQVAAFLAAIEKPKDGKDGKDGVGFDDLQFDFDGERTAVMKFIKGEVAKVFNLIFPVPLDKGVWKQGQYERADIVQRDGSMWIAEKDTSGVPGHPGSGWRLSTKRGRDGKDGKQGPEGPQGKPGRDGRDLTQIGPNGEKW